MLQTTVVRRESSRGAADRRLQHHQQHHHHHLDVRHSADYGPDSDRAPPPPPSYKRATRESFLIWAGRLKSDNARPDIARPNAGHAAVDSARLVWICEYLLIGSFLCYKRYYINCICRPIIVFFWFRRRWRRRCWHRRLAGLVLVFAAAAAVDTRL